MKTLRVLLPLDGSRSAAYAVEAVKALSMITSVSARLVGVMDKCSPFFAQPEMDFERQETEFISRQLERLSRELESLVAELSIEMRFGPVATAILRESESFNADLVAMARKGRGATQWRLGHITNRVVRDAACSVLLTDESLGDWKRVLLALDGSGAAEVCLDNPVVAALLNRSISLVRVVELPAMTEDSGYVVERLVDAAWLYLEAASAKLNASVESEVLIGDAASELRDYADAMGGSLIVVGATSRLDTSTRTLGSVTDRLLDGQRPLLVVRP